MRHPILPFTSAQRAALIAGIAALEHFLESSCGELTGNLQRISTDNGKLPPLDMDALSNLGLLLEQGMPTDENTYRVPCALYVRAKDATQATASVVGFLMQADDELGEDWDVESFLTEPAECVVPVPPVSSAPEKGENITAG